MFNDERCLTEIAGARSNVDCPQAILTYARVDEPHIRLDTAVTVQRIDIASWRATLISLSEN